MNYNVFLILFVAGVLVSGCGPSAQEKEEIAIIACNVVGASPNMDGAMRIKELNKARDKIGGEKFVLSDDVIRESVKYGLCSELVLNDPNYDTKLYESKSIELKAQQEVARIESKKQAAALVAQQEAAKIESVRRAAKRAAKRVIQQESARIERERWTADRVAQNKAARIEKEAKREAEKIVSERLTAERNKAQKKWRDALLGELHKVDYQPKLISATYDVTDYDAKLKLSFSCAGIDAFSYKIKITFHNNLGVLEKDSSTQCQSEKESTGIFDTYMSEALLEALLQKPDVADKRSLIKEINIEIYAVSQYGFFNLSSAVLKKRVDPQEYPPLKLNEKLDNPIVYKVDIGD
jgi:hypothetical protein